MISIKLSDIIAPSFQDLYKNIKQEKPLEIWAAGGRGSTKSSFFSLFIFLILMKDINAHAFISRRYDNELRDSVFGQMQWAANKLNIEHKWRFKLSPMQIENSETGQKILFRGVDNPLKAKSINLGKGFIKIFWAEEVDQYGSMEELRNLIQSLFRGEGEGQISLFSFNPPKSVRSWVNQEIKLPKAGRIVHKSDYRSVPKEWLGERFIIEAEHLKAINETAYRHEYLGEEIGTGLEVFNNIEVRQITQEERKTFNQIEQGLDFGYAVDPLAFIQMYYDTKKRILYILNEVAGIGIGNRAFAEKISQEQKKTLTIADNAEPKSINELREYGLNIMPCTKGPGSVEHGIKWLTELTKIVIDPFACPLSAKEFTNYSLELTRSGDIISKYPDKNNHAIDSVRYATNRIWQRRGS